jgi:hypothetical protein
VREYHYTVDRDGRIYHEGSEILDPPVLRFFLLAMQRTPDGRYLVICQGERNWFETPDTPFVIQRVRCSIEEERLVSAELYLAGDYHEPLVPENLESDGPYLYCRVRNGMFRARFGRNAVQHLAPFLVEEGDGAFLLLDRARHSIRQPTPFSP